MHGDGISTSESILRDISLKLERTLGGSVQAVAAVRGSATQVVDSVLGLQTALRVDSASDPGSVPQISLFFERAGRAADAADEAVSQVNGESFRDGLSSLVSNLGKLRRHSLELEAITAMTRIANADAVAASGHLSVFVERLDQCFTELRSSAVQAMAFVRAFRISLEEAITVLNGVAAKLRGLARGAEVAAVTLERLEARYLQNLHASVEESSILRDQVAASVRALVSTLQFPDALSQRIAHVHVMLSAAAGDATHAEKCALHHLAAAQLHDMANSLEEALAAGKSALKEMPETKSCGLALADGRACSAWIDAKIGTNDQMVKSVGEAAGQLDAAVILVGSVVERIDAIQELLDDSRRQNEDLIISVHNASILAGRYSNGHSPLHVLSGGVRNSFDSVSNTVSELSARLSQIRVASEALKATPLVGELDGLRRIQEQVALAADRDARIVQQTREARASLVGALDRLAHAAGEGLHIFATAEHSGSELRSLACRLVGSAAASPHVPSEGVDLSWVYSIYTMEEERKVHLVHCGLPVSVNRAPDPEDSDLDGFLF